MIRKFYNTLFSSDKQLTTYIRSITGVTPSNLSLYKQAFQHRSRFTEPKENNERLELLGDAILDAIVCEYLFKKYPYKEEGFITELRSKIVNRKSLNDVGTRLGLVDQLKYNKKSMNEMSRDLAGNTFEALIGAVYLDTDFETAKRFVHKRILQNLIDVDELEESNTDYKSRIYHYIQKEGKSIQFKVVEEKARNRRAYFIIHLEIDGIVAGKGEGFSKKAAEQNAAMNALNEIEGPTEEPV